MIEPIDALYYGCQQVKVKVTPKEAEEMTPLPVWGWSLRSEKEEKLIETSSETITHATSVSETSTSKNSSNEAASASGNLSASGSPSASGSLSASESPSTSSTKASSSEITTTQISSSEASIPKASSSESSTSAADSAYFANQVYEKDKDFDSLVVALRKAMEINNRREFIIFVHGCCIGFEGSMNQAAALEEATRIPVVAYAWGSVRGNYGGSTMTYPRSQERFNYLVRRLLKEFPEEKITLAGNSVGNMMIVEYCLETCEHSELRKFDNIIISRADMDAFAFKTQVKHVVRAGKHVSLYVAKNDPQINISGVLRWFFNPKDGSERVGNTRSAPMYNCDQKVVVYDVSALKLKHIMPHRAVSELLNNDGCAPQDSPYYTYTPEKDNTVRVTERPGKTAERQFANATGE